MELKTVLIGMVCWPETVMFASRKSSGDPAR